MNLREQQMASTALEFVSRFKESKQVDDYANVCMLFPNLLMVNGLRLTVEYFSSKSKEGDVHPQYLEYMNQALGGIELEKDMRSDRDFHTYRALTLRALQAATWFKRYAEAMLKSELTDERAEET